MRLAPNIDPAWLHRQYAAGLSAIWDPKISGGLTTGFHAGLNSPATEIIRVGYHTQGLPGVLAHEAQHVVQETFLKGIPLAALVLANNLNARMYGTDPVAAMRATNEFLPNLVGGGYPALSANLPKAIFGTPGATGYQTRINTPPLLRPLFPQLR